MLYAKAYRVRVGDVPVQNSLCVVAEAWKVVCGGDSYCPSFFLRADHGEADAAVGFAFDHMDSGKSANGCSDDHDGYSGDGYDPA